jgi:hypothetical protein
MRPRRREAAGILGLLPPWPAADGAAASGGYPEREARWLVATCWNAGLARLRAGDKRAAAPLLGAGLALQRHVPWWGAADRGAMERVAAEAGGALDGAT